MAEPATPPQRRRSFVIDVLVACAIAVAIVTLLQLFVARIFWIPSGSMQPLLQTGDRILVNKLAYQQQDPQPGDVIVFNGRNSLSGTENEDFVKRVIGVGGDRITCCTPEGTLMRNGMALSEPYLFDDTDDTIFPFDVIVPDGKLWVMGDHRAISADSRAHLGSPGGGFVPVDEVIGQAVAIVWPLSNAQWIGSPAYTSAMALFPPYHSDTRLSMLEWLR